MKRRVEHFVHLHRDSSPNNPPPHAAAQLESSENQIDPELEEDLKGLTQA